MRTVLIGVVAAVLLVAAASGLGYSDRPKANAYPAVDVCSACFR
ncbi:hypothetical protein [Catenulispora rubra]|nr:hypothetical protein [Catenulispora rubra]